MGESGAKQGNEEMKEEMGGIKATALLTQEKCY